MGTPAAGMGRMNEWPEGWFRDGGAGRPPGTPGAAGPGEPTANVPASGYGRDGGQSPGSYGASAPGRPGSGSAWPAQPPVRSARRSQRAMPRTRPGGGRGVGGPGGGGRRWLRPRRIFGIVALVLVVVIVATVGLYLYLNSKLIRIDALTDYAGRPAPASGTNWLITGSDSRQGLTRAQER